MKYLLIAILTFFSFLACYSQTNSKITKEDAAKVLEQLSHEIEKAYLYSEKAERINIRLSKYAIELDNMTQTEIQVFVGKVNTILFDESSDHHLKFYYDPDKFKIFQNENQGIIDSLEREQYRRVNFGVQKVEILSSNIGLMRLNKFQQIEDVKEVIQGAMLLLANSDAIIIDLRINGGGDGRTKEFLESFFLTQEQFLKRENQEFIEATELEKIKKANPSCQKLELVPLYILTGNGTFSAAEGFCYDLQQLGRAQIIGARTKGGGYSGSSVPLSKGFLVFIPTSGKNSPIEGVGITPDVETSESSALLTAQKQFIDSIISSCSDSTLISQYRWHRETIEASLYRNILQYENVDRYIGQYNHGFSVELVGKELYLVQQKKKIKSELIPINKSYFIAVDNLDFGYGNYRIQFSEDGKAKLLVNLGVKIAEMKLEKNN